MAHLTASASPIPITVIKEVTRASRSEITQLFPKETPLSRTKFKFIQLKASNFLWFYPIIKSCFHIFFLATAINAFDPLTALRAENIKLRKSISHNAIERKELNPRK